MAVDDGINGFFWLSLAGLFFGSVGLVTRFCYQSKCENVQVCCIKVKRNIETEKIEDLKMQEMKSNNDNGKIPQP